MVPARKQGKPPGSKRNDHENFILSLVRKQPDIRLDEIAEALKSEYGAPVCPSTMLESKNQVTPCYTGDALENLYNPIKLHERCKIYRLHVDGISRRRILN
ncbi:MAG: hypothetical protein JKY17_06380 [Magnetovibrio sp.]|nr:hypothetical protein [Magnetovibrio sp.]